MSNLYLKPQFAEPSADSHWERTSIRFASAEDPQKAHLCPRAYPKSNLYGGARSWTRSHPSGEEPSFETTCGL